MAWQLNKKNIIIISFFLLVIMFFIVLILVIKTPSINREVLPYQLETKPLLPPEQVLDSEYIYTYPLEKEWTVQDFERWFTVPTGKYMEQLENSNDKLIKNILEVAP